MASELEDSFGEDVESDLPAHKAACRRDSISSAALGFDDLDDFCAKSSLQATEHAMRRLRRCMAEYAVDPGAEDDPYLVELLGTAKARLLNLDEQRLQVFVSSTADARHEDVSQKTRGLFRKVQAAVKLTKHQVDELQEPESPRQETEEPASKLAVKGTRTARSRRSSNASSVGVKGPKKQKQPQAVPGGFHQGQARGATCSEKSWTEEVRNGRCR
ncbi:unnamed protein product [Effrenium voratum]|nr:unnamed protein product [Effrenium voratum]